MACGLGYMAKANLLVEISQETAVELNQNQLTKWNFNLIFEWKTKMILHQSEL